MTVATALQCYVTYFSGSKIQSFSIKYSENFSDCFISSNDRMTESESTQKLFYTITGHNKLCIGMINRVHWEQIRKWVKMKYKS